MPQARGLLEPHLRPTRGNGPSLPHQERLLGNQGLCSKLTWEWPGRSSLGTRCLPHQPPQGKGDLNPLGLPNPRRIRYWGGCCAGECWAVPLK